MSLIHASHTPPVVGPPDMTVLEACKVMERECVASIGVVDREGRFLGLFEERDLARRLVLSLLEPETTAIGELMQAECRVIAPDRTFSDALNVMLEQKVRHLPIVDEENKLLGVLSLRTMLAWKIDDLDNALRGVTSYFAADGIGGG